MGHVRRLRHNLAIIERHEGKAGGEAGCHGAGILRDVADEGCVAVLQSRMNISDIDVSSSSVCIFVTNL